MSNDPLRKVYLSKHCQCFGCSNMVKFNFLGVNGCFHYVCGFCLSKSLERNVQQLLCFCPKCTGNYKEPPCVTYDILIQRYTDIYFCTTCFRQEAIYRPDCGHLLCEDCLESIDISTPTPCSIQGCPRVFSVKAVRKAKIHVADIKIWREFQITRFQKCGESNCERMAMIRLVKCKHLFCLQCLLRQIKERSERDVTNDSVRCKQSLDCRNTFSTSLVKRLEKKMEDDSFKTAVDLEISPCKCIRCGNCDNNDINKARLRNRNCYYNHAICIPCFSNLMTEKSNNNKKMDAEGKRYVVCPFQKCGIQTPLNSLESMIGTVIGTCPKPDIFFRDANFLERCSHCRLSGGAEGFKSRVVCSHATCKRCLQQIAANQKAWYDQCEGDSWRCKYIVPLHIIQDAGRDELVDQSSIEEYNEPDVLSEPDLYLEYCYDTEKHVLSLKCTIKRFSSVQNETWTLDDRIIDVTNKEKYSLNRLSGEMVHLKISNVKKTDEGTYKLSLENSNGRAESNKLIFNIPPKPCSISLQISVTKRYRTIELQGQIKNSTKIKAVQWLKDGKHLDTTNADKYSRWDIFRNSPSLFIYDANSEDIGEYQIYAEDENSREKSNAVQFNIEKDPPRVRLSFQDEDPRKIYIRAVFDSEWPITKTEWQKDFKCIKNDSNFFETKDETGCTLHFLDRNTNGNFRIIAESVAGVTESDCFVVQNLQNQEPYVTEFKMTVDRRNQNLVFTGRIESTIVVRKVELFKDGVMLERTICNMYSNNRIYEYKFTIGVVDRTFEGEYYILAENEAGGMKSKPVRFSMDEGGPSIIKIEETKDQNSITLTAVIDSEWPVTKLTWSKGNKPIETSRKYKIFSHSFCLKIYDLEERGTFKVVAESIAGVCNSTPIVLGSKERPEKTTVKENSSGKNKVETILVAVDATYKRRKRCDMCNLNMAVGMVDPCGHCFCRFCLKMLLESALASMRMICCVDDCQSTISGENVQQFIKDADQTALQTPLYFELMNENHQCGNKDCHKLGFVKMLPCCHIFCSRCILKDRYDTVCKEQITPCQTYTPSYNFQLLKKSLEDEKINPFLTENCKSDWTCYQCRQKNAKFKIIRCGHSFCMSCITSTELPVKEGQPFTMGKCLIERCEELFPFPMLPPKLDKNSTPCDEAFQSSQQNFTVSSPPTTKTNKKDTPVNDQTNKRKQDNQGSTRKKQKSDSSKSIKSTGLSNVGLSCYRNTILQTLAETPNFLNFLEEKVTEKSPDWIGLLVVILKRVKEENTAEDDMLEYLHHFHFAFNEKHTEYKEFQQEDTLSFFTSVLNGLQEEFNTVGDQKECQYKSKDPSSLFLGALKTRYHCKDCRKHEDVDGETFFSLPLPVKESKSKRGRATIGSCIQGFLDEEEIDAIPCKYCRSNNLIKEQMIARYPDVLVLQICKLEEAGYGTDYRPFEKNTNRVLFWENFSGLKTGNKKAESLKKALKYYRLVSVVEHFGSESSGHYICYVRRQSTQEWCRCDDSYVREVKFDDVKTRDAYLLFYEKVETPLY